MEGFLCWLIGLLVAFFVLCVSSGAVVYLWFGDCSYTDYAAKIGGTAAAVAMVTGIFAMLRYPN